jgi:SAM-dependent methyltransferase
MPTEACLERYYGEYYDGLDEERTFHDIERLGRHVWKSIDLAGRDGRLRILDFGGGDGSLAKWIARYRPGQRTQGPDELVLVDLQESAPSEEADFTFQQVRELSAAEGTFDLVLASAIIEHVPLLQPVIRELFSKAARPGWFYARTPYVEPFCRLSKKIDVTFPGHVHDMGDRFWNAVPRTFALGDATIVHSRPSPVDTSFWQSPVRALAAHLFKLPARLEGGLFGSKDRRMFWTLVGGWEVVLRFDPRPD